jgi:hypothetical protein
MNSYYILSLLFIIYTLYIIYILFYLNDTEYKKENPTLEDDGFIKLYNIKKEDVLNYLPEGYMFIDYKYTIKGCSISTYHRDVTSSQYIYKTKYPVYTYSIYFNKGSQFSVCPGSHKSVPFNFNKGYIIKGEKYDSYLFNCDLIHAGAMNEHGDNRYFEQYKICHKKDLNKLKHLIGLNDDIVKKCNLNFNYEMFLRKISLLFPFISNHIFTKYLQSKQNNIIQTIIDKIYKKDIYNM